MRLTFFVWLGCLLKAPVAGPCPLLVDWSLSGRVLWASSHPPPRAKFSLQDEAKYSGSWEQSFFPWTKQGIFFVVPCHHHSLWHPSHVDVTCKIGLKSALCNSEFTFPWRLCLDGSELPVWSVKVPFTSEVEGGYKSQGCPPSPWLCPQPSMGVPLTFLNHSRGLEGRTGEPHCRKFFINILYKSDNFKLYKLGTSDIAKLFRFTVQRTPGKLGLFLKGKRKNNRSSLSS